MHEDDTKSPYFITLFCQFTVLIGLRHFCNKFYDNQLIKELKIPTTYLN